MFGTRRITWQNRLNETRSSQQRNAVLNLEFLEARTLLSANLAEPIAKPAWHNGLASIHNPTPTGYTPQQVRESYGFDDILFNDGTIVGDGSGQTIAIVVAHRSPNIEKDLQVFSDTFDLPDANFKRVSQTKNGQLPSFDAGWALETALDVQWAHAIAPKANILLVEAYSASYSDMFAAVDYARRQPGVSVVSMSWGANEFASQSYFDRYLTTPAGHTGVTFVAASGDSGGLTNYPSVSPNVISVGGTSLRLDGDGNWLAEYAWYGSDGGVSRFQGKPAYQKSVNPNGFFRTTPDVSYNASMVYGVSVYSSVPVNGQTGWFELGGTSAGAPQWAGLVAIANQGRALAGLSPLDGRSQTLPAIYNLPSMAFLDVTQGQSGLGNHQAGVGYDLLTGRGSPVASIVVYGLMNTNAQGSVFGSPGATVQVVSNIPSSEGTTANPAAAGNTLAFIQAVLSSLQRDFDSVVVETPRSSARDGSLRVPVVVVESSVTRATPRVYRATLGYKTASGEEAPYWMEAAEAEEDVAPNVSEHMAPTTETPPMAETVMPVDGEHSGDVRMQIEMPTNLDVMLNHAKQPVDASPLSMAALTMVLTGITGGYALPRSRSMRLAATLLRRLCITRS